MPIRLILSKVVWTNTGLIKMFFTIFIPSQLEPEVLQFVCDVVKDTGKEEYLRPFIRIGLDWIVAKNLHSKTTVNVLQNTLNIKLEYYLVVILFQRLSFNGFNFDLIRNSSLKLVYSTNIQLLLARASYFGK